MSKPISGNFAGSIIHSTEPAFEPFRTTYRSNPGHYFYTGKHTPVRRGQIMTEALTNALALIRFGVGRGGGAFVWFIGIAVAVVAIMALMRPRTDPAKQ